MFAGVLDGTADQVMMGEGALNRFMKTVETASASRNVTTTLSPRLSSRAVPCESAHTDAQ